MTEYRHTCSFCSNTHAVRPWEHIKMCKGGGGVVFMVDGKPYEIRLRETGDERVTVEVNGKRLYAFYAVTWDRFSNGQVKPERVREMVLEAVRSFEDDERDGTPA